MQKREIEVLIDPFGNVTIEALGFEGASCEEATKELERVLGEEIENKRKSEYYTRPVQGRVQQRG